MQLKLPSRWMVFDVESVGLHGEGFAVGAVILDAEAGASLGEHYFYCGPEKASGHDEGRLWVAENVPEPDWGRYERAGVKGYNCHSTEDLRSKFWSIWLLTRQQGGALAADCAWPVEARFLAACIDDQPKEREWQGPYPLHDIASMRLAAGFDPLATEGRFAIERPAHDPLCDARQSARLLFEAIVRLQSTGRTS